MTQLKRIDVGNRIKADTLGNGNYEVGIITAFDKSTNTVTFESKRDGQEVKINRRDAEKCSKKEYEEFVAKYEEAPKAATIGTETWESGPTLQGEAEQDLEHGDEPEELSDDEAARQVAEKYTDDDADTPEDADTRSIIKRQYRDRYQKSKDMEGKTRVDNGDTVASMLRGKDLETVYTIAAEELGVDSGELEQKYTHLNPGQQRMVLGNRLRALYRKQEEEGE